MVTQNPSVILLDDVEVLNEIPPGYGWYEFIYANITPGTHTLKYSVYDHRPYIDAFTLICKNNVSYYKSTGNRIAPALDLSPVGKADTSTISWTENVPANTTLTVETSINGGTDWSAATNGGAIPGITNGMNLSGVSLLVRATLNTTDDTITSTLNDITVQVTPLKEYYTSGNMESPAIDLSSVATANGSTISWTEDTAPAGTSLTVETNFAPNGTDWQGWQAATNGGAIAGITAGTDTSNAQMKYRVNLATTDVSNTPTLQSVTLNVLARSQGNRVSPGLDLTNVGTVSNSIITWNETLPDGTAITVETSIDGGSTWQTATNGSVIPGLTPGVDASGKNLVIRQTLENIDTNNMPQLHGLTVKVSQNETDAVVTVKPITNEIVLIPTNVTKWQLEERPYETTWEDDSRQAETLTLTMAGGGLLTEGTFEVRAYEDGKQREGYLWDSYGTDISDRFYMKKQADGTYAVGFNNAQAFTVSMAGVGFHVYSARWDGSDVWLLIDGSVVANTTLGQPVSMAKNEIIYLGSSNQGDLQWNNLIDELRASKVARADGSVDVGQQLPIDSDTLYKLDFDGSIVAQGPEVPTVAYGGTAKTHPIITATFKHDVSSFKVLLGTRQVSINYAFKANDVLVIDHDRATIKVNGLRIMNYLDIVSDFFALGVGNNDFTFDPADKADVVIKYKEKWL